MEWLKYTTEVRFTKQVKHRFLILYQSDNDNVPGRSYLMKQIAGICEPLPHVVIERAPEVACVGQVHQAVGFAVEEIIVSDKNKLKIYKTGTPSLVHINYLGTR